MKKLKITIAIIYFYNLVAYYNYDQILNSIIILYYNSFQFYNSRSEKYWFFFFIKQVPTIDAVIIVICCQYLSNFAALIYI